MFNTLLSLLLSATQAQGGAQRPPDNPPTDSAREWNTSRVLDMIQRARVRRAAPRTDTTMRNYAAHADGFVYFYLDRKNNEERTLVRVDQIALNLYWAAPNLTK